MAKPIISIIGLGLTGASMGLGLQREGGEFEIVGHDKNLEASQIAKRQGAVHRTEWNLHRACEGADLIVTAVPLAALDELFSQIAEDLKPGALVLAITSLLQPAIEDAARHLPANAHFVAGHPVLSGVGSLLTMRADLFEQVTFSLAPGLQTDPSAVQLASDFVERVGATPLFVDAQEHDGILAGVEQMPQLLGAALMRMSAAAPGWREARRLAGRQFAGATDVGHSAEELHRGFMQNRQNLLQKLEKLQEELDTWRALLAADGEQSAGTDSKTPLLAALESAVAEREQWEGQALLKKWDEAPTAAVGAGTESSGFLRQMFFGRLIGGRSPRDKR
jgi:prephenate dehydrogenase